MAGEPRPASAPAAGGGAELFTAFLEGAGLDPQRVRQPDMAAAMRDYGMLFRVVVQGMMEVLMARASLKSEFRMPLTTIRPVENNPLKFSPGVDEALYNLFVAQGRGYLGPVDAIQEGFTDIRNHQMAMMAGMQAAFRELMEIFNPDKFDKDAKTGMRMALSINRKSRAWEAFCEFYEQAVRDPDSSFQNLFGENFALAYEDQIRRLSMLK
jgi:type VI secretion system FHA domain protein